MRTISAAILSLFLWTGFSQNCTYRSPDGSTFFDLQALSLTAAQGDYIGYDSNTTYTLNICAPSNSGGECTKYQNNICRWTNNMTYLGAVSSETQSPKPEWSLYDFETPQDGLILTSYNGPNCTDTKANTTYPTRAHLLLRCNRDASLKPLVNVMRDEGGCIYHFRMESPNACPSLPLTPILSGQTLTATFTNTTWLYYAINITSDLYEFQVEVKQLKGNGSLALYIRRGALPTINTSDARDLSTGAYHSLTIRKNENPPLGFGLYYIAVQMNGTTNITFTLQANTYICPRGCSGHGSCSAGVCSCDAGYESLSDCSAPIFDLQLGEYTMGSLSASNSMVFYRLTLKDSFLYELFVEMNRVEGDGLPVLMIAKGSFPSLQDNLLMDRDYDTPGEGWSLTLGSPQLGNGTWIIGVMGSPGANLNFYLIANLYDCPHGCSGHGFCDTATHQCRCEDDYIALQDCSVRDVYLHPNKNLTEVVKPLGWVYFRVDFPENLTDHDLAVTVTQNSGLYPRVYVGPDYLPTLTSYFRVSPLPGRALTVVRIATTAVRTDETGVWYVGVYNPYSSHVTFSIMIQYEGVCYSTCHAPHGSCNPVYPGVCDCAAGWQGVGCDVGIPTALQSVTTGIVVGLMGISSLVGVGVTIFFMRSFPDNPCLRTHKSIPETTTYTDSPPRRVSSKGSINKELRTSYVYSAVSESEML